MASPQQPPTPARDEIRSAGKLGYWGSILMFIPGINIVGIILIILALRRLSKAYNNEAIWRNAFNIVFNSSRLRLLVWRIVKYMCMAKY